MERGKEGEVGGATLEMPRSLQYWAPTQFGAWPQAQNPKDLNDQEGTLETDRILSLFTKQKQQRCHSDHSIQQMSGSTIRLQPCGMESYRVLSAQCFRPHRSYTAGRRLPMPSRETQEWEGEIRETPPPGVDALETQGSVVRDGSLFWEASSE